jgi:hypothetical protein
VVRGPEGAITRPEGVTPGLALELEFASGRAAAIGGTGQAASTPEKPKPAAPRKKSRSDDQGSLL